MRKRSVGINVRVSVTEKRKMTLMAKRYGLSLSEYLRQRALGYEPGGHPPKEVFNASERCAAGTGRPAYDTDLPNRQTAQRG